MSQSRDGGAGWIRRPPRWPASPDRHSWVWWAPVLLVLLDVVLELTLYSREPVSFLLIAVPPLAAATRSPRRTALAAALCVLLEMWMASRRPGHFAEQHHVALYLTTVLIGVASVALARQRIRAQEHLVRARSVAEAVQLTLLRPIPERLGRLRAAGFYEAGEGGTLVGGDLYDLCETPFGVRVIVGDVRGKGLDAVQTVSAVLGSFRVSAHEWRDLSRLAERLELSIARNSARAAADAELFVTALLLEFPTGGGEVRIVDRGHPAPVVVGPYGARRLATSPALPLALGELAPGAGEVTVHPVRPGEVLVVYTDGVSEARNADGVFYPLLDRLAWRFAGRHAPEPQVVAAFVRADADRWSAGAHGPDGDDRAVLALAPEPLAGPERRRREAREREA
ncbi:PP2C family protein-serine/threonine phosphatase [Kitasatospora sp. NPDC048540]|uniref:PP2C family protein-serine/threonine phosphatase n=1 Tax=unclassified Kitasatospora TaxID=2633591 RepID=UPI0007C78A91|nr:PP2C family protein-serine/threonine phosphatase [Kitasatospora sp. MBT63]